MQASTGAGGSLYFGLPVPGILNSLVTLELDADSMTLVQNVAPGTILSAQASLIACSSACCKELLVLTGLIVVLARLPEDFCLWRTLMQAAAL